VRFLDISSEKVLQALASWQWLPLQDKQPFHVTVFGDLFLRDRSGIYFLDTIQGSLESICETEAELDRILASPEGADRFLMSGLVAAVVASGITLGPDQCLNFKIDLVVGGDFDVANVQALDFVAAVSAAGQIHEQVKDLAPGTPLTFVELAKDP
jgi:hypothetical protein